MSAPSQPASSGGAPPQPAKRPDRHQATGSDADPPRPPDSGLEIAKFLVEDGVLTPQQLAYALRVRAKLITEKPLLSILN